MIGRWLRTIMIVNSLLICLVLINSPVLAETKYPAPSVVILHQDYNLKLSVTTSAQEYIVEWDTDKDFSHKKAFALFDGQQYGMQLIENAGQEIVLQLPRTQKQFYIRTYAVYYISRYEKKVSAASKVVKVNLQKKEAVEKPKGEYAILRMQSKRGTTCKSIYLDLQATDKEYNLPVVQKAGYQFQAWKMQVDGKTVTLTTENGACITPKEIQEYVPLQNKKKYTVYATWKKVVVKKPNVKVSYVKEMDCIRIELKLPKSGMGYMLECSDKKGFSYKRAHVLYQDDGRYLVRWNPKCISKKQVIYIPTYEFVGNKIFIRAYGLGEQDSTGAKVLSVESQVKKISWKSY